MQQNLFCPKLERMAEWMEELERLAKLRDNGVISSDEFESLKRKLVPDTTPPEEQTTSLAALAPQTCHIWMVA